MKSKAQVIKASLKLDQLPNKDFIAKYERLAALDNPEGIVYRKKESKKPKTQGESFNDFKARWQNALLAESVGDVLAKARTESGLSLTQAAKKTNLTRGRMAQLENDKANLEIQTIVKQAQALGYKVRLSLEPEDGAKSMITVVLPR
jgi:ribosome-binding protein aMBF1 (putative translation factor)